MWDNGQASIKKHIFSTLVDCERHSFETLFYCGSEVEQEIRFCLHLKDEPTKFTLSGVCAWKPALLQSSHFIKSVV